MTGLPVVPNLDAWRGMYRWNLGAWKALVGPLYGNAEEIATYQERAPWYYQLASEGLADPLNMVDPFSDAAIDSIRVARAMAKVTPTAKTVAEISAGMMREGQQASGVLAKVNPFRHTNDALQHELVQDAAEALTRIANAAPAGEGAQWVSMLARSPDTLADATGGYAASPQAKRASALLQRLLTPEGGTVPEYRTLEKIVAEAKGDEIAAVSSLAAKLQGAAESFFPSAPRGTLKAGRDWVNNLLSTVYMGYSRRLCGAQCVEQRGYCATRWRESRSRTAADCASSGPGGGRHRCRLSRASVSPAACGRARTSR